MSELSDLIAQRDALVEIRRGGVQHLRRGDNETTFQDMAAIDAEIAKLQSLIDGLQGGTPVRVVYHNAGKGL